LSANGSECKPLGDGGNPRVRVQLGRAAGGAAATPGPGIVASEAMEASPHDRSLFCSASAHLRDDLTEMREQTAPVELNMGTIFRPWSEVVASGGHGGRGGRGWRGGRGGGTGVGFNGGGGSGKKKENDWRRPGTVLVIHGAGTNAGQTPVLAIVAPSRAAATAAAAAASGGPPTQGNPVPLWTAAPIAHGGGGGGGEEWEAGAYTRSHSRSI